MSLELPGPSRSLGRSLQRREKFTPRDLSVERRRMQERDPLDVREANTQVFVVARIIEGHQLYLAKDGYWVGTFYEALAFPGLESATAAAQRHNGVVMKLYLRAVPVADAPMREAGEPPLELEGGK